MTYYTELVLGSFMNRGYAVPTSQINAYQQKAVKEQAELYRSYYFFDEAILEHLSTYKTITGFKGTYYLKQILFDIDAGVDKPQFTHDRAKAFVNTLIEDWDLSEDHILPWFSGRGFHIVTPDFFGFTPSNELPKVVSATMEKHFPEVDQIFDKGRIIRVGNTINMKAKLYKVPIPMNNFFNYTIEQIIGTAKEPAAPPESGDALESPQFLNKIVQPERVLNQAKIGKGSTPDNPTRIVTCMHRVIEEGPSQGSRHQKLLRLASTYRRAGVPFEVAAAGLAGWANTLKEVEVWRIVKNVYEVGYRYGCDDEIMKKYCDPRCIYFKRKDYTQNVLSAAKMEKDYVKFIRTDFKHRAFNMNQLYDLPPHRGKPGSYVFYPGELVVLWGDTGLGKTTFVQNLCVKLTNMKILYLSLEVHANLLYRKFIQIVAGWTKEQVMEHYKESSNSLSQKVSHISVMTVSPSIEAIRKLVAEEQPNMVVIDTLDGISYSGRESDKSGPIAIELKEIAQQLDTIIFAVHHISKDAALDRDKKPRRLNIHSGKGSSSAEQKADKVIGIEGNMEAKFRTVTSFKARDESPLELRFIFDKDTFKFVQY
jgi:hypothetical protein